MTTTEIKPLPIAKVLGDYRADLAFRDPGSGLYVVCDGRVAIRTTQPLDGIDYGKQTERSLKHEALFAGETIPVADEPAPTPVRGVTCLICQGTSWATRLKCDECNGDGESECEECGHCTPCDVCRGKGYLGKSRCECSDGQVKTLVKVGPLLVNPFYFAALMAMPKARVVGTSGSGNTNTVRFAWDGGEAIVAECYGD